MANENWKELHDEIASIFRRFQTHGDLAPPADRQQWDALVQAAPNQERELLRELANFVDLWRYLQERGAKLGREIVDVISELHKFPLAERSLRVKCVNQKLMERLTDAGESAELRQ